MSHEGTVTITPSLLYIIDSSQRHTKGSLIMIMMMPTFDEPCQMASTREAESRYSGSDVAQQVRYSEIQIRIVLRLW